jgi:hypothetical protein
MSKWFIGKQKHLLIWAVLIVYLFSANSLVVNLFQKNGKPADTSPDLPAPSNDLTVRLGDMQPVRVDGEDLYEIRGYAFVTADPTQANQISVVLSAPGRSLAFLTRPVQHANMIESAPNFKKGMEQAEFSLLLAKNALRPGTYQVGLLLEEKDGVQRIYAVTPYTIQKTPNTLRFNSAP